MYITKSTVLSTKEIIFDYAFIFSVIPVEYTALVPFQIVKLLHAKLF